MERNFEQTPPTIVEALSRDKRHRLFLFLFTIFIFAVPFFIFYATGYRYDFFNNESGVTATGGLYIGVSHNNGEIFIDDEPARGSRIFRRATYIQSVIPGIHRVHVQGDGLQTWVKDLPVFPHMVTEADAFLLPVQPLVRVIASTTESGLMVLSQTEETLMTTASTSFVVQNAFVQLASTTATSTILPNIEYQLLAERFNQSFGATSTATSSLVAPGVFRFADLATGTASQTRQTASIVARGNQSIILRDGELFAQYLGGARSIPHYYCVSATVAASTTELYGAHVAYGIERAQVLETAFQPAIEDTIPGDTRLCRTEIRLDTKGQEVIAFDFFPGSTDVVVVQQANGVYVIEIDDRAWQNVQTLIGHPVEAMIIDNNRIFFQIDTLFFEVTTDLSNI